MLNSFTARHALLATVAVIFASQANALPLPTALNTSKIPASFTAVNYDFEGIVALWNCSGSVIRLEKSQDTDTALVLTNGHCLETGFPEPGEVISHQASTRTFKLMKTDSSVVGRLHATEIVYSSMTKTDITIYRLKETYADITKNFSVRPFMLVSTHPTVGQPMQVVSGYWSRGYECQIEAFIPHLKEGGWLWDDSIRYSRPGCEVIGGTSGSPIVQTGTRNVIGINNTGNMSGEMCTADNPCEEDAQQQNPVAHEGYSYGEQTYQIYSCINAKNELDLTVPGCMLAH